MRKVNLKEVMLREIIRQWKNNFTGISSLELSEILNLDHKKIILQLNSLVKNNKISINKSRLGKPFKFKKMRAYNKLTIKLIKNIKMINTYIAFPNRKVLEDVFIKENMNYGIYTNRLHKGDNQLKQYYFKQEVLDKYFKYSDRFIINDDVIGGCVLTKSDYYLSLSENVRETETFGDIRYGRRELSNGELTIIVIVADLFKLPIKEQQYWHSFEIDSPNFKPNDRRYTMYFMENYEGKFLNHNDPICQIEKKIDEINLYLGEDLFSGKSNPLLKYPVINNKEAYRNAHKELYKLIGTDSINIKTVKKLLIKINITESQFLNEKGEEKGAWNLFKTLINNVEGMDFSPFNNCWNKRVDSSHKINIDKFENLNYINQFFSDCISILHELDKFLKFISKTKDLAKL